MKTEFHSKAKSYHVEAQKAADELAENKDVVVELDWRMFSKESFKAQVQVFLFSKYNISADSELMQKLICKDVTKNV